MQFWDTLRRDFNRRPSAGRCDTKVPIRATPQALRSWTYACPVSAAQRYVTQYRNPYDALLDATL